MNILIISQLYYPEEFLINEIAEKLAALGNNVTVVTGLPHYPHTKIPKEYRWFKKRKEIINGVEVIRNFEIPRGKGALRLAINYLSFVISGYLKCAFMKKKYDVVFCYQLSPVTMGIPAIKAAKKQKAKLVMYTLDIFPESIKSHISNEKNFIYKMIAKLSKRIYNKCDKLLVTSPSFIDYMVKVNNVAESKLHYIPQHYSNELFDLDLTKSKNGYFDFMFAGNIGYAQDIDTIVYAAKLINVPNVKFHIVGDGSRLEYIKKLVYDNSLEDKFIFYGKVNRKEMYKYYKKADCLLLTLRSNTRVGDTIPGKLQAYMSAGKMIIAAINGDAQKIINEANCGLFCKASDYEKLAENILEYINNVDKYKDYGLNGKKYFEKNFTIDKYINNLLKYLNNNENKEV